MAGRKRGDRIILRRHRSPSSWLTPILWVWPVLQGQRELLVRHHFGAAPALYAAQLRRHHRRRRRCSRWVLNSVIVSLGMTLAAPAVVAGRLRFRAPGVPGRARWLFVVGAARSGHSGAGGDHRRAISCSAQLRLHNTYTGLILPGLAMPFGVFLMTQYFRAIPHEIDEAALLDSASRLQIFWRVLLPLTFRRRRRSASSPSCTRGTTTGGR